MVGAGAVVYQSVVQALGIANGASTRQVESLTAANAGLTADKEGLTGTNEQLVEANQGLTTANGDLTDANAELTSSNEELAGRDDELTADNDRMKGVIRSLPAHLGYTDAAIAVIKPELGRFWLEIYEGLADAATSTAACPVGTAILGCMCYTVTGARGCHKWYAEGNSCLAFGDTGE